MTGARDDRRALRTLEQLLQIEARDLHHALDEATTVLADVLDAEKVDAFLRDADLLRARGTSETPLGKKQQEMGLDVLPIVGGGRTAQIYENGTEYLHHRVDEDEGEIAGMKELGVRSAIGVPLIVGSERRGALLAASTRYGAFDEDDLAFLRSVARWVGVLAHRVELTEGATRSAVERGRRLAAEELVTVLAHDLGNYLTPLRGRLELLLRSARREDRLEAQRGLEMTIANVDAITALTADLLDVSRIEEGLLKLAPAPLPVRELLWEVVRGLETGTVRIIVDVPRDLTIFADHARIRQVLSNLLANALHHSPVGTTVTLSGAREPDAVVLRVTDEGPGVPSDIMPRVFTRYARGPRSTGLGIGLYLAERIVAAHGGTLVLDSTPSGATFTLRLPGPSEGTVAKTDADAERVAEYTD